MRLILYPDFNQLDDQQKIEIVNGLSAYKQMVRHLFVQKAL